MSGVSTFAAHKLCMLARSLVLLSLMVVLVPTTITASCEKTQDSVPYAGPFIVNSQIVQITSLYRRQALLIFTGKIATWPSGYPIKLVTYAHDSCAERKLANYLFLTSEMYAEKLQDSVETGRIRPPLIAISEFDMLKKVEETPGSIGFLFNHGLLQYLVMHKNKNIEVLSVLNN